MKKDQKTKLSQLSLVELEKELVKENQTLAKMIIDKALAKLKNVHQIDQSKKKIALIKTRINQEKTNLSLNKETNGQKN